MCRRWEIYVLSCDPRDLLKSVPISQWRAMRYSSIFSTSVKTSVLPVDPGSLQPARCQFRRAQRLSCPMIVGLECLRGLAVSDVEASIISYNNGTYSTCMERAARHPHLQTWHVHRETVEHFSARGSRINTTATPHDFPLCGNWKL